MNRSDLARAAGVQRSTIGKTPAEGSVRLPNVQLAAAADRMDWMRQNMSDYEIALPRHEIESFASGEGYRSGLGADARRAQLERMAKSCEQLHPSRRIFIYEVHRISSAPLTVFGPLLGVIHVGSVTLAFRQAERVRSPAPAAFPQDSGWPRTASSSASAWASVSTLIVAMPMARAGFRLIPRSSRKTQACGSTPRRSQARR